MYGKKLGSPDCMRELFHINRLDMIVEEATQERTPAVVMRFQKTPRKKIAAKGIIM
jgi:hypothetical protein